MIGAPQEQAPAHPAACGAPVEEGPVARSGALGPLLSSHLRDPDGNLVEFPPKWISRLSS